VRAEFCGARLPAVATGECSRPICDTAPGCIDLYGLLGSAIFRALRPMPGRSSDAPPGYQSSGAAIRDTAAQATFRSGHGFVQDHLGAGYRGASERRFLSEPARKRVPPRTRRFQLGLGRSLVARFRFSRSRSRSRSRPRLFVRHVSCALASFTSIEAMRSSIALPTECTSGSVSFRRMHTSRIAAHSVVEPAALR